MNRIGFGFDLHNTLVKSNEAWIDAFMETSPNSCKNEISQMVYHKVPRKAICERILTDYNEVYQLYCQRVYPYEEMIILLESLKEYYPVFLISSANKEKVYQDLHSWNGQKYFNRIYTKENFTKSCRYDWEHLLKEWELNFLFYIGNDADEDIPDFQRVISLISGTFLRQLDAMGILFNRNRNL